MLEPSVICDVHEQIPAGIRFRGKDKTSDKFANGVFETD